MPRTEVTIDTEDGSCAATLHTPAGDGGWPAVILYADAGGVRDTFDAMADQLAGLGYAVLLPNIYYRVGSYEPFDLATAFSDPGERERVTKLAASLTGDMVVRDGAAFLDFLAGRDEVTGSGVGTTGYCMGGRLSLIVAGNYPDRVAAAASFHGGNLADPADEHSPYKLADRIRGTVYVAAAANDAFFPPEQYERLERAFNTAGVRHTMQTYPAAHGFAVPDNPTYDAAAADRHWTALADLYGAALHA